MAPSSQRIRLSAEQMLGHQFLKRASLPRRDSVASSSVASTPAFTVATPVSSSNSSPSGVTLPPHGVAALVGIIVMLSVFILGFAAWRVWVFRRSKDVTQSASNVPGLFDPVHDQDMKRTLSAGDVASPPMGGTGGTKAISTAERTAAEIKLKLAYHPKLIYAASSEKPILAGASPSIKVTPPSGLQISPPPVYAAVLPPVLSPRTAASKGPRYSTMSQTSRLPRLVVVESTFAPSLHDELSIHEGEKLQLLEEYEDEWCLVQRVGLNAAEKGVIPRFCVVEC